MRAVQCVGLYNRRGFLCLAERLIETVRRSARDILLFFIDVDGLKRINDSFGHQKVINEMVRVHRERVSSPRLAIVRFTPRTTRSIAELML
jgi:diguanylate cyclase (GGDEF)-like protein